MTECTKKKVITNFNRIKAMNIEEMTVMLADEIPHGDCYGCDKCDGCHSPIKIK